ncbi:hypothetical protein ACTQ45_08785 [Fundicoccus sp. Sow4_D5]
MGQLKGNSLNLSSVAYKTLVKMTGAANRLFEFQGAIGCLSKLSK